MNKEKSKVTLFLLPGLLKVLDTNLKKLEKLGFIDSFIQDKLHPYEYKDSIYLLFKPLVPVIVGEFADEHEDRVAAEYDYEEGYVVVVFQYPARYISNYYLFLDGKYSKFSKEYKDIIPKPATLEERNTYGFTKTLVHQVFDKDKSRRDVLEEACGYKWADDWELMSIWGDKEVLDINKYLQNQITDGDTRLEPSNEEA